MQLSSLSVLSSARLRRRAPSASRRPRASISIGDFVTTDNAKDADKVARLFTDGGAVMPPNASTVRGTENVRVHYQKRFDQGASNLDLQPQTVAGSGALAFASGDYRLKHETAGGPSRRVRGKFIFILRELNARWLLDRLMFSSDFCEGGLPRS